eukprot:m.515031 g.515031  ORF g.515031 m.515031 type:complete len:105 (+) comp57459_c0_seq7:1000-1314(+)
MFRTMRVNMSTNHPALLGLANATDFALDAGVSDDQVAYQTDDHFTDDMLGRDDHTRWGDDAADDDPHHDTYSHRYAGAGMPMKSFGRESGVCCVLGLTVKSRAC